MVLISYSCIFMVFSRHRVEVIIGPESAVVFDIATSLPDGSKPACQDLPPFTLSTGNSYSQYRRIDNTLGCIVTPHIAHTLCRKG